MTDAPGGGNGGRASRLAELSPEQRAYLTRLLGQGRRAGADEAPLVARARRAGERVPCSFAQQRLWFLDRLEPGDPAYIIVTAPRLRGLVEADALAQSLERVVARHEVLRTTFTEVDGEPVQEIGGAGAVRLARVDLSSLPRAEAEAAARAHAQGEATRAFDLARGPLLRATLLTLAAEEHVLLLALHHIVTDGWSMGVLFRELTSAYAAAARGTPVGWAPLPVQYADFAVWQRAWVSGARLEQTLAYWRTQLAGLGRLELPTDRPRPAVKSGRGASVPVEVPARLTAAVQALARQEQATVFMTLLAALAALLGRYSGEQDIAVGSPIANRTRAELEGLIGFFVNTLVLRVSLAEGPSFRTLIGRVKAAALGAYAHQDLPFEQLVEALQPQRDLSRNPLFQVMFQLQSSLGGERPGSTADSLPIVRTASVLDLELNLWETGDRLEGVIDYSTDLFDAATIERMAGHFATLLEAAVADPDRSVAALPILTAWERRELFDAWNATDAPVPESTIHALIDAQAARTPDVVAVRAGGQRLTYRELTRRANQLAHVLRARGIDREAVVAILLERSVELIVAVLGVLKAGAAYLPMDPTAPPARLASLLADADATIAVTRPPARASLPADYPCVDLDRESDVLAAAATTSPTLAHDPAQLAYVMYTSGSTGSPKGVEVAHGAVVNLWSALNERIYRLRPGAPLAVTVNGPLTFDTSLKQIVQLLSGHTLHIVPDDLRTDAAAFVQFVRNERIDVLDCTPSQLRLMIEEGLLSDTAPHVVLVGGEALDEELWDALSRTDRLTAYNMYGPTECTGDATVCRIDTTTPLNAIGGPLANTEVYILDEHGQPVPVGVPGELHIGGRGLARGYRRRPDLTAERFRPNPFRPPPARLYATGDRVRFRADGLIEFLGRLDAQIKLHGYRIEPAEIESALRRHPAIRDARVVRREDVPGDARLVAYLVGRGSASPPADDVVAVLRADLPAYMVPAAYVWLARLPLTPNGKLDVAALPPPDGLRPALTTAFVAARTPTEAVLAAIWQELLAVDRVGVHDDFFADLGGHSLLATRVISQIRKRLAVELPLRLMFTAPTISGLSSALERHRNSADAADGPVLRAVPRDLFRVQRLPTGCMALPEPLKSRLALEPPEPEESL